MNLANLGLPARKKTILLLGAGASRGSSFVGSRPIRPPLDTDFFIEIARLADLSSEGRRLLRFVAEEYGIGTPPSLETFFTQVTALDSLHTDFHLAGRSVVRFKKLLRTLRDLIPRVFEAACGDAVCVWHRRMAAALRSRDTILSFNYDCLMDEALRAEGGNYWIPKTGYGFSVSGGDQLWSPAPTRGPNSAYPVLLLKPHGSLNWKLDRRGADCDVSLVAAYQPDTADSVVPPTWDKAQVAGNPWKQVWLAARRALDQATVLVAVGYSVPQTDLLSQALIRTGVTKLDAVVLVNPDAGARQRTRQMVASAMSVSTRVLEYESLADFASMLPESDYEKDAARNAAHYESIRRALTTRAIADVALEIHPKDAPRRARTRRAIERMVAQLEKRDTSP